jgi:hypothetical protein
MFDSLVEYFVLVTAKKDASNRVGYRAGARPLYWAISLLVVGLILLWRYFA